MYRPLVSPVEVQDPRYHRQANRGQPTREPRYETADVQNTALSHRWDKARHPRNKRGVISSLSSSTIVPNSSRPN